MLKLQAVELSKSYKGRKVVDDVEVEIGQGEVVGLLGPNGAGKTTTFYMIVGLARPDSGRVLLNGDEITDLPMYLRARSAIVWRNCWCRWVWRPCGRAKPTHYPAVSAAGLKSRAP